MLAQEEKAWNRLDAHGASNQSLYDSDPKRLTLPRGAVSAGIPQKRRRSVHFLLESDLFKLLGSNLYLKGDD